MVRREILYSRSNRLRECLEGKGKTVATAGQQRETAAKSARRQPRAEKAALRPLTARPGLR